MGDMLLSGPAIRAVARTAERVVVLAGPRGEPAANLLPGVDETFVWCSPWIDPDPPCHRPRRRGAPGGTPDGQGGSRHPDLLPQVTPAPGAPARTGRGQAHRRRQRRLPGKS